MLTASKPSIKPLANIVSCYICSDRQYERKNTFHFSHLPSRINGRARPQNHYTTLFAKKIQEMPRAGLSYRGKALSSYNLSVSLRSTRPGCGSQHPPRSACILLAAAPTAPPCFRRWRRSSPLPLVGEPLAKRRGFTVCQGLSYKERWHCAAMTERLDKGEATHERKTQKNRHLTVTVRLSVQFIMTHSQTHPLRPFAGRRWRWCRGPRGRRPSRRQGCPPPLSQSCP